MQFHHPIIYISNEIFSWNILIFLQNSIEEVTIKHDTTTANGLHIRVWHFAYSYLNTCERSLQNEFMVTSAKRLHEK